MAKTKLKKKEIDAINGEISTLKTNIEIALLSAMGYDVTPTGDIIDQETFMPVVINKRFLKYNSLCDTVLHKGVNKFDPTNDYRLTNILFSICLEREFKENGIYSKLYYPVQQVDGTTAIELIIEKDGQASKMSSLFYRNQLFAYLDIIFSFNGIDQRPNLQRLDELKYVLLQ